MAKAAKPRAATPAPTDPLGRLRWIIDRLRSRPGGCPWDLKQTHVTLKPYLLEEACEVIDAIDGEDPEELCKELGDLLLQIVLHSRIAAERKEFDLDAVATGIAEKLVLRHPHVFGGATASTAEQVLRNWEKIKMTKEKRAAVLEGIPRSLPALLAAYRIQEKVSSLGFDWERPAEVAAKVAEEVQEFLEASRGGDPARAEAEFGDVLFSLVALARHGGINGEFALQKANDTFRRRFTIMEELLRADGKDIQALGFREMDAYWAEAKSRVKERSPGPRPGAARSAAAARKRAAPPARPRRGRRAPARA